MRKKALLLILPLLLIGCNINQTPEPKGKKSKKITSKKVIKKKPQQRLTWKKDDTFGGKVYRFHGVEFTLTDLFTPKGEGSYFAQNGINLVVARDESNISLSDYLLQSKDQLKKAHRKAVLLEKKQLILNGKEAILARFMIDKERYLIQIHSILLKDKDQIYSMSITGKRKEMIPLKTLIEQIFRSIEFK